MVNTDKLKTAGVNVESLLKRLMGNDSLIRIFIKKFIEDKSFAELVDAFGENDRANAELKSHTLKGMCGNLSLDRLYALFTEQTNLIRAGEFEKAREMMPELTSVYDGTIEIMKAWLEEK